MMDADDREAMVDKQIHQDFFNKFKVCPLSDRHQPCQRHHPHRYPPITTPTGHHPANPAAMPHSQKDDFDDTAL